MTTLYRAGIDTQQICAITKHKNESTLSHYITSVSDLQKQQASNILTAAILGETQLVDMEIEMVRIDTAEGKEKDVTVIQPFKMINKMVSYLAQFSRTDITFSKDFMTVCLTWKTSARTAY